MNEIIQAMEERRSIRQFKPDMPDKELIDQVLEAGLYAASAKGRQDVIMIAVTKKELRDRLSAVNFEIGGWTQEFDPFYGAPVVIIVLAEKEAPNHVYDGSLVMGNLMLAAHSLGLGSIWIHRCREEFEMPEFQSLLKQLKISGEWEGIGHCCIGYIDGEAPKAAPRNDGRIFYIEDPVDEPAEEAAAAPQA